MKNIEVCIREETSRKLNLKKNSDFLRFLKAAVEMFCKYPFTEASYVIFKLLYEDDKDTHNKILKKFGFTLCSEESFDSCVEYFFIEEDAVLAIAEELQFQYIESHPHFLKVKSYTNCEGELNVLKALMENHPLLLYRAVESAWSAYKDATLVQSCVNLLLSEKTVSQVKGLEKLNHNPKHQQLLLPYAKEIGLLLKAMHNESEEKQRILAAQEELNALNKPFAPLAQLLDKFPNETVPTHRVTPSTDVATASEQPSNKAVDNSLIKEYSVSPELSKFLDNKAVLTFSIPGAAEFWEQMAKLREIGIDLNQLVDNLQLVLAVLSFHENLENATGSLIKANKAYETAIAKFCPDNMESLHALFAAGRARQDAKNNYVSAYENFVVNRDLFENAIAKI